MIKDKSRIQSCVDHINTAVDVDPWAKELVAEMGKEILEQVNNVHDLTKNADRISRQAAIDLIDDIETKRLKGEIGLMYAPAIKGLRALPSAQPETAKRIVGKSRDGMTLWYQCDMCNEPVDAQDDFCRGCGRRLTDG